MPKILVQSSQAPVTGFTDASKPSPLAQAIRAGDFLYVSGQGPLDPVTRKVTADDIATQTRQVLANLAAVLEAGGATIAHVVNMRVCLRNTSDFPVFNETFREVLNGEKVTRTCTGGTPHRAGVLVEIDCVAYLG
ncbi:RidA family protein [Paraburkholderia caballeronis]|uniref:Endoribonuclease L-PSP n=1 Tax=Paraburkholderia caballeronis TaxID=416943 RepID=A0A1H7T0B7_9BURK|nr:RidA family protein [Paraburkholderia caballeronis]PXW25766.1 endoribonuclease L-PSP [Paraburkholderia caballeronis]PXX01373.1 endoribonuclease L-PSP [Paraburkholderia caballeronis]RAJ99273.1 endoribonuclease L-PSP [Paraburkholderia caballeronis]SEE23351.1 endoribonuclease L-PSP [Paraburkholderia caballeronis]SEL78158.1 endoribonuclease L-PSP [Paraburkholderia caballeronis]